jgi:hypothetical protein
MRDLINNLSAISILIPLVTGIVNFKKFSRTLKAFFLFFIFSFFIEIITGYLNKHGKNNLWLINIYLVIEFSVFSYFTALFSKAAWLINLNYALVALFLLLWIFSTVFFYGLLRLNNLCFTLASLILFIMSAFTLFRISTETDANLFVDPIFWIVSSIFIYFSANLFIFCLSDLILDEKSLIMHKAWIIHSFWNIVANILFSIGFLCRYRKEIY